MRLSLWLTATGLCASLAVADDATLRLFETSVRPFLAKHCYECHSAEAKRIEGGLYLDSLAGMLEGGDSGPAIVPGQPDESLLVEAIRYDGYEMPPSGPRPTKEIEPVIEWVRRGAVWPASDAGPKAVKERFDRDKRKAAHWSWRPIESPTSPVVKDPQWSHDPVDAFIKSKLNEAGLSPSPPAKAETWLRRVYFDLVGLPPSPEETQQFLSDASQNAREAVIDRLLASPHFGEHWARHWLDLARYAETYGHEFDYDIPHAWKYRDYVVRALNADVPYDQFAREQLAGDLQEEPRRNPADGTNESVQGTGFLFLGEAVHAPTDALEDQSTRIENQIDVLSRTFLGLSVACARCHDHKFDPIATEDYYSLFGIMRATYRDQALLDPNQRIADTVAEISALCKEARLAATQAEPSSDERLFVSTRDVSPTPGRANSVLFASFDSSNDGWTSTGTAFEHRSLSSPREWDWQRQQTAAAGVVDSGRLANKLEGTLRSPTFTIEHPQVHWRVRSSGATFRVVIETYFMHDRHQLLFGDTYKKDQKTDGWGWVTHTGNLKDHIGKRAFLEVVDDGDGRVEIDSVWFGERPSAISDPETDPMPGAADTLAELNKLAAALPRPERVLAAADGHSVDEPIHIRGGHHNLGDPAPRRFVVAIAGKTQPQIESGSGRFELAQRMTDPANSFFARVAVNRVWHHLYGRGLVPTVDDFGVMGQPPSHPQLLDHLASSFIEDGYSLKRLIKRLVLTRTYEQASNVTAADSQDPDNVLLYRSNLHRLSGEQIRDTMLAITGELDRTVGGPSVPVHLTAHMTGRGRPRNSGPLDGAKRRSLYISVRRNFLAPAMLTFDTPSPFSTLGKRNVSNVPAQSLVLMNSPFVMDRAKAFAERLLRERDQTSGRIDLAYQLAFARNPTTVERTRLTQAVTSEDDLESWTLICHALFNVKEFIFIP